MDLTPPLTPGEFWSPPRKRLRTRHSVSSLKGSVFLSPNPDDNHLATRNTAISTETSRVEKEQQPLDRERLTITFRKHDPVNPVNLPKSYQSRLISTRKELAAELYLTTSIRSLAPCDYNYDEKRPWHGVIVKDPVNPIKVRQQMHLNWMQNYNVVAVARAHGQEAIGKEKLTEDGSEVKSSFMTMNFDREYESLLEKQNQTLEAIKEAQKEENVAGEENEAELLPNDTNIPFGDLCKYYFDSTNVNDAESMRKRTPTLLSIAAKNNGIIGAVPIECTNFNSPDEMFFEGTSLFNYKRKLYRTSPMCVIIPRIDDYEIEAMKSKPEKITMNSAFYSALTSYFDKKNEQNET